MLPPNCYQLLTTEARPCARSMQEALIRQFQAEIAALRAQLAGRQQGDEASLAHADAGAGGGGGGVPGQQGRGGSSGAESAVQQQQPGAAGAQADAEWRARHREGLQLRMQAMSSQASLAHVSPFSCLGRASHVFLLGQADAFDRRRC